MESKSYAALAPEKLAALDPNTSYARIREMVGSGKRVLDVGCGPGNLATVLRDAGNAVVGVDIDDDALTAAQRACERTIKADLDRVDLDAVAGDERFDVVVFADVLEHLRNPARLLTSSRRILRDGGCVIVSIPNVAHGAVRLALLRGRFDYQQLGVLDDSHLRFYTRESVMRLLSESGFTALRVERTTASVFESSDLVPFVRREDHDPAVVAEILRDEDAETLQFIVRAAPLADDQAVAVLTREISGLQQAVRTLRAQLAQAREGSAPSRFEGPRANGNGTRAAARLAEVEQHYRNALALAERTRAERDAALKAAQDAGAELERLRPQARVEVERAHGELGRRHEDLAAAEQTYAELETASGELAERDAVVAASAAALEDLRASHEAAIGALEPLRAELLRVQQVADGLQAELAAALTRSESAAADLVRATAATDEVQANLRAARALAAGLERELDEARNEAAALRAQYEERAAAAEHLRVERDELALRAATAEAERQITVAAAEHAEREARSRIAALQDELETAESRRAEAVSQRAADRTGLRQRAHRLENLLAVERTTRENLEDACDRIVAVAHARASYAADSELKRLQARSAVVDLQLRLAMSTAPRVSPLRAPQPAAMQPAQVLRAATIGRRTLLVLPYDARRERLRARWRRLRRLFPLVLLLAVCLTSCAQNAPVITETGPAFVRIGDDQSVYFLPGGSNTYCLVAEPVQMKLFGGFARVKQYDAGARFAESRRLDGTCRYPDGTYRAGNATYVLHGDAICRDAAATAHSAIEVSDAAKLAVSRRDTGRCRQTG